MLHWKEVAKEVEPNFCLLKRLEEERHKIDKNYIHLEFYNWEEPKTETSYDVCMSCLRSSAVGIKLAALKTLGKNPAFTPSIICRSINTCPSYTPSKDHVNCGHIALKFVNVTMPLSEGGAEITLRPLLYCKRAHPNEFPLPSEQDLDWNVAYAGVVIALSEIEKTMKAARKEIEKNPALAEKARAAFQEKKTAFEEALGIIL